MSDVTDLKAEVLLLRRENAELRELAALQSVIFRLQDENAKLRELVVLQSVISKHMSTCPTTDCQACPVNEECAESVHLEGVLGIDDKETSWLVQWRSEDAADVRAENAKLRELVDYMTPIAWYAASERERDRMRELGVEAE